MPHDKILPTILFALLTPGVVWFGIGYVREALAPHPSDKTD